MTSEKYHLHSKIQYCNSLTAYSRRKTIEVQVGDVPLGSDWPIRIQSMTTVDTMDTNRSVDQAIRMITAGCEYIRITAPSLNEAKNLENIKKELLRRGYNTPLIADIHFTPNAAELSARIVEKVRVNPGNYVDKKKFDIIEYSDEQYQSEIERIETRFTPLVNICKEYGTAMRIGTNHGSLSDRILSRYGDTPLGMVESALEFLRICESLNYYNIVLSMKASNTQVMIQAYRLLVQKLSEENLKPYPLHLGVTEAGEGEDGRIKSALGIGTLLEDGLGDTVRVSLTEDPEFEAPVAIALVNRYSNRIDHDPIKPVNQIPINPFGYKRRSTVEIDNIGGSNVPRVIADFSYLPAIKDKDLKSIGHYYLPELDKWTMNDTGADYIYSATNPINFMLPNGLREIVDYNTWINHEEKSTKYPLLNIEQLKENPVQGRLNFLMVDIHSLIDNFFELLRDRVDIVLVVESHNNHGYAELRRLFYNLIGDELNLPVIIKRAYTDLPDDKLQLYSATDIGGLLIDGLGDGVWLSTEKLQTSDRENSLKQIEIYNNTSFGVLQAARTRMSKTEYISCPSCGRTLFDLQETTAMIRKRTDHLKGVKIGIMGCIVNGPGEMADADYGYVGSGKGKITLYRGQEVVKRGIPSKDALDELIQLIKEDSIWVEPQQVMVGLEE